MFFLTSTFLDTLQSPLTYKMQLPLIGKNTPRSCQRPNNVGLWQIFLKRDSDQAILYTQDSLFETC